MCTLCFPGPIVKSKPETLLACMPPFPQHHPVLPSSQGRILPSKTSRKTKSLTQPQG